ncbi:hypothetical protein AKJ37_07600 [candidate division MSBL1 archaeon SCGC-AAA259I09]|uniref:Hydrogenase expression protein HupH n=1 Tax=candidate division MSBL1 archaeon SCGC-AAA259I09 TaxID=1698267 RepID=A0A133UJP6_9EURY|nr:hypothetical protein AKJ37_07600 [candidate division MSBL1 archaeon SCGC-AAA259I09]
MKLKIIVPCTAKELVEPTEKEANKYSSNDTKIDVESLDQGTKTIESSVDNDLCAPDVLRIVEQSISAEYDGIIIESMTDTALESAREIADIPVVGPGRTSMLFAADLANSFSIITVLENLVRLEENLAKLAGMSEKLVSVRHIGIPVLGHQENEEVVKLLREESIKAIEKDGAQAIILGCGALMGIEEKLSEALLKRGYNIPLIYPLPVTIKYIETLVSLRLTHSKKCYPTPKKEIKITDSQ